MRQSVLDDYQRSDEEPPFVNRGPNCKKPATERELQYIEERYWWDTYDEIADALGMGKATVFNHAKSTLNLPKKNVQNSIRYRYGVPVGWLLSTLHHTLGKSVNQISKDTGYSRDTINRLMEEMGVKWRGQSEAEEVKWSQMSESERASQVAAAHSRNAELAASGELSLQKWFEENPKEALEQARRAAALGAPARETNGMEGLTGQDSPFWRGGKSLYDAVKKQLARPDSWNTIREGIRERDFHTCRMCGEAHVFERALDVHHIVPILCGGLHGDWNLLSLCQSCHAKAEWYTRQLFGPVLVE